MSLKPIKTKTHLVKSLLSSQAIVIAIFGFLLSSKLLPFFPTVECKVLTSGELQVSVIQSTISLFHLGIFVSFILTYLHFEFYGFKSALYSAANTALGIIVCFMLLQFLNQFAMDAANSRTDALITEFFSLSQRPVIAMTLATGAGLFSALFIAATLKTMTRNYLMILRFPLAGLAGFAVLTFVEIYINKIAELAPVSMAYEAAAPFSQFAAMVLVMVIPLYFLRFILGIFRGRLSDSDNESEKSKSTGSLFKAAEAEIPAQPVQQQNPAPAHVSPVSNVMPLPLSSAVPLVADNDNHDDIEHTVSKKIRFDTPQ